MPTLTTEQKYLAKLHKTFERLRGNTGKAKKEALAAFQKLRRLQESVPNGFSNCISCEKLVHWKQCDGGHFIPRRHNATAFEKNNVWPQCRSCNDYGRGNVAEYRKRLVVMVGLEEVVRLESLAQAEVKYTIGNLVAMRYWFDVQWKRLEKELDE